MVIAWTPAEDAIIRKQIASKLNKTKTDAFATASVEIEATLGIQRTSSAVAQRYSSAKLGKQPATELVVVRNTHSVPVQTMAYNVAEMAIAKLTPGERMQLVEKMLNNEL